MKFCVVVILFLITSIALAQPPRIDSMSIDESKGLLSIYGDFGFTQGKVWCDSVELTVVSWNNDMVIANIPDTGKGSAGSVWIESLSNISNKRILTLWKGLWSCIYSLHSVTSVDSLYFSLRGDFNSIVEAAKQNIPYKLALRTGPLWVYYDSMVTDGDYTYVWAVTNKSLPLMLPLIKIDSNYDYGYQGNAIFDIKEKKLKVNLSNIFSKAYYLEQYKGHVIPHDPVEFNLGNFSFEIPLDTNWDIKNTSSYNDPTRGKNTSFISMGYYFPPPDSLWFMASVPQILISQNNLIVYPNPAKDILHIRYSVDNPKSTHIAVYDLRGNLVKLLPKDHIGNSDEIDGDVSSLPSGNYVIGVTTGSESRSAIVSIVK